jgi:multiple sugar transport system substrate-binding protein
LADYWNNLATNMTAGTAPDVFTDHLGKYPEFAANEVLLPLNDFIERDGFDTDQYFPGLAELWVTPDGSRYGLPKDWDTVVVVYNRQMLRDAGITEDQLRNATWNANDGGTFEDIAARLSVDADGVRGDEPGFDPNRVRVFGLGLDTGGLDYGHTTWAGLAASTGFELLNKNPWGTRYHYDDPRLVALFNWYRRMIERGFMPPLSLAALGQLTMMQSDRIALAFEGSWMIGSYSSVEDKEFRYAPQPRGPEGSWSMFNGLADSIYRKTDHPEEAWQWVKFMASLDCQRLVGESAVVFPAIPEAAELAVNARREQGIDVSAFTSYIDEGHTVLFPITDEAALIADVVSSTVQSVMLGDSEASVAMKQVTRQVNSLLD